MATQIRVDDNGPYVIGGEDTQVFDVAGNELRWAGRRVASAAAGAPATSRSATTRTAMSALRARRGQPRSGVRPAV